MKVFKLDVHLIQSAVQFILVRSELTGPVLIKLSIRAKQSTH